MKRLFDMENPLMQALSTAADLIVLNLLTILCSLPVVTIGAALTAQNAAVIKLVRGEETSPAKDFFRAFRENFKKGTALGLLFLLAIAVLMADYLAAGSFVPVLCPVIAAIALLVLTLGQYAFALLARYENTLRGTLKNAFLLAVGYFPRTLGMAVFAVALWLLAVQFLRYGAPILFLFGLSLPCYMVILLLRPVFAKLETTT
ncbi:MAG: YesL family protein [Eubacteriales bacterium]|nr:YesL family protein [Eubacteriales bacterium]